MKTIIITLSFIVLLFWGCGDEQSSSSNLTWETNLQTALNIAKKENRAVLVNFTGSDWCKWCIKLSDEVFTQSEFEDYAKNNLVLVRLDFPRSIQQSNQTKMYNQTLAQQYGVQGFPTILIFNSTGKLVAKTGYQYGGAEKYVEHIQSFL